MLVLSLLLAATITAAADIPRVSPDELVALMDKNEAVVIDVRGSVPYELGHIKNAKWLPLGLIAQRIDELPQDKLIVAYCTCKAEETSLEAAQLLSSQYGYRVAVLHGGYPAWKEAGHPIEAIQPAGTETEPAPQAAASRGGRLAPPAAVACDRNELTSHAGKVKSYERHRDETVLVIDTSAGTTEKVVVRHKGSDDPSRYFLIVGTAFTSRDWSRIESKKGQLLPDMSAIAWVCGNGTTYVDWRPGATFSGAE
jgi:rhodanese-related sulfurtransferase